MNYQGFLTEFEEWLDDTYRELGKDSSGMYLRLPRLYATFNGSELRFARTAFSDWARAFPARIGWDGRYMLKKVCVVEAIPTLAVLTKTLEATEGPLAWDELDSVRHIFTGLSDAMEIEQLESREMEQLPKYSSYVRIRPRMEFWWKKRRGSALGHSQHVKAGIENLQEFRGAERRTAHTVIIEWLFAVDSRKRDLALSLVDRLEIVEAIPALHSLAESARGRHGILTRWRESDVDRVLRRLSTDIHIKD